MQTILEGAGWFIWPLGFCSVAAMVVIVERLLALREGRVLPRAALELILSGKFETATEAFPRKMSTEKSHRAQTTVIERLGAFSYWAKNMPLRRHR